MLFTPITCNQSANLNGKSCTSFVEYMLCVMKKSFIWLNNNGKFFHSVLITDRLCCMYPDFILDTWYLWVKFPQWFNGCLSGENAIRTKLKPSPAFLPIALWSKEFNSNGMPFACYPNLWQWTHRPWEWDVAGLWLPDGSCAVCAELEQHRGVSSFQGVPRPPLPSIWGPEQSELMLLPPKLLSA